MKAAKYFKKNPERKLEISRRYAEKNKELIAAKTRAWYLKNKQIALVRAREFTLKTKYGMTPETFQKMLKTQKNKCAICAQPLTKKTPPIDHCHKTGKVRGILCYRCNTGLGQFLDDPKLLLKAATYLRK